MRIFTILLLLLVTLNYGNTLKTRPDMQIASIVQTNATVVELWEELGGSYDSLKVEGDSSSGNLTVMVGNVAYHLLLTDIYGIGIKKGKFENIEIGMGIKETVRKLRRKYERANESRPYPNHLNYIYGDNNYILSLEFKNKQLTRILIFKEI